MSWQARVIAALAFALALAAGAWRIHSQADKAGYARAQGEHAQAAFQLSEKMKAQKDEALTRAAARTSIARADAGSARSELDRLRNTLSTPSAPAATCTATPDRADPARELFGQCAAALVELADKADRHAGDALTLFEAWPRE